MTMLTTQPRLAPTMAFARLFATTSLAVVFIWFGLMNISGASAPVIEKWLKGHMVLSSFTDAKGAVMLVMGSLQLIVGFIIALHNVPERTERLANWAIVLFSVGALSLLLTNPVWDRASGGFPAIGSGQGLIKYIAIAGLALWALHHRQAEKVMLVGLIVVLGWIGAMKFTASEADGIWPLLTSSPAFKGWLTVQMSKQAASNFIGVIEIATALLLTARWWNAKLYGFGLLFTVYTLAVTLSFLITFPGAWNSAMGGFPYLTSAGQFLLKDLLLMAATLVLAAERP